MKKLTSLFLAVVMCLLSMSVVFAEDGAFVKVADVEVWLDEAVEGENPIIEVPINISSNPGIASYEIQIEYDPTCLKPVSAAPSSNVAGALFIPNLNGAVGWENYVFLMLAGYYNMTFEGELATVKFEVLSDECGVTPLKFTLPSMGNETGYNIDYTYESGSVTMKKHAAVETVDMVDTTDVEGPNPSITSFKTTIDTYSESLNGLTWNISYDGTTKSFANKYDTIFTGTVQFGLYVENLYVADESLLDVDVEIGKGE